jgi:hypothetical protein
MKTLKSVQSADAEVRHFSSSSVRPAARPVENQQAHDPILHGGCE